MTLTEWLEPRLEGAPPGLAAAIRELARSEQSGAAVPPFAGEGGEPGARSIPAILAAAALRGFDEVLGEPASDHRPREAALRLLAADAALTYAFEAAADLELDVVGLADRVGPLGALGKRLAPGSSARDPSAPGSGECVEGRGGRP